jgi:hypothetical protein
MEAIGKLFGMGRDKKAEQAAAGQANAAHAEAEEAKRRRMEQEQQTAIAGQPGSGSMFLANRGTRYSGLKPSLGG